MHFTIMPRKKNIVIKLPNPRFSSKSVANEYTSSKSIGRSCQLQTCSLITCQTLRYTPTTCQANQETTKQNQPTPTQNCVQSRWWLRSSRLPLCQHVKRPDKSEVPPADTKPNPMQPGMPPPYSCLRDWETAAIARGIEKITRNFTPGNAALGYIARARVRCGGSHER